MSSPPRGLQFYLSHPHECGYLDDQLSISLFADPHWPMDTATYGRLVQVGFRRSGRMVYRPHCPDCSACEPVRIPISDFKPRRSQRRALSRNTDLEVTPTELRYDEEHYALYQRYLESRHAGGPMEESGPKGYQNFLTVSCCDTRLVEFRDQGRLVMVAVVDYLPDGLSAVYLFYDPSEGQRSLGVYGVLWQIEEARRLGLPYVYLGYWIKACRKMAYKTEYQPLEHYLDKHWQRMPTQDLSPLD